MRHIFITLVIIALFSCSTKEQEKLKQGTYRAILTVQDNQKLPFNFKVVTDTIIEIYNADEVITINEIRYNNDSVIIQTPVFEGYIKAKITKNGLQGNFIKESYDRVVAFNAHKNKFRFDQKLTSKHNITGNWETVFSKSLTDEYIAKGIFNQQGNKVTGTFRTTTGDYRYLEGIVDGDSLKLSTFDGAHAFLFTAKVTDSSMIGNFYSGLHWKEPFVAKRNKNYELPSAENLTFLKNGYETLQFSFPDKNNQLISLTD